METALRFGSFIAVFVLLALWEWRSPRRPLSSPKAPRWCANLSLIVADAVLLRLMGGLVAFSMAVYAHDEGWGLFNTTDWPPWIEFVLAVLVLDFALYAQHFLSHHVPLLWRLHRVHHTDLDIDLTTGVRFHPLEIGLSMLFKVALVIVLGAAPWAVLIFEIILNGCSMFSHSNVFIPESIDRGLRRWMVTPDMHRVHHSTIMRETNSNFGFSLSCWDHWCGTYRAAPVAGQLGMTIGLDEYRDARGLTLLKLLALPFRR